MTISQKTPCPLRIDSQSSSGGATQYSCSVGVTFSDLGPDAVLCQHCQVLSADLETFLQCPHSDLYTFIDPSNPTVIQYDVQCFAQAEGNHCKHCPYNNLHKDEAL